MTPQTSLFYDVYAHIELMRLDDRSTYMACSECNKKLTTGVSGDEYRCEKCDKYVQSPLIVYNVLVKVADSTGSILASAFREQGQQILGVPAKDFWEETKDDQMDPDEIKSKYQHRNFAPFRAVLKAQFNEYQGEGRIRYNIVRLNNDFTASYSNQNLSFLQ